MVAAPESLPDLFARALELDQPERRALLAETLRTNAALGAGLARLLDQLTGEGSPIDRSPWRALGGAEPAACALPAAIGPYRVVRELGRGGMARVYLAEERTDLFCRTLAVKVLHRAPFDDGAIRRFRDEVRILSSLEHPGIARFLQGGRTDDGVWYLALEHVDGDDLLAWARARALPTRARVELFLEALVAVSYAHARGVVHRDLKPDHLLIDRFGRPRLLDFGISKLVDPETGEGLSTTHTEARAMTPAYASPEQFRGEPATPASDVYSLGAILYELLAGRRPFEEVQAERAIFERAVLDSDPEPPSTVARRRATTEPRGGASDPAPPPSGTLGRDLDAICLKALRKSPAERYADASELGADLRAYLDGRAVAARRGGRRYRLARFAKRQRHRLAVGAALAVAFAALALALVIYREAAPREPPPPRPFPFSEVGNFAVEDLRRQFAEAPESVEAGAALALRLLREPSFDEARLVLARLRQIPGQEQHPLSDYVEAQLASGQNEPQRALVHLTRARERASSTGRGDLLGQIRAARGRLLATLGRRAEAGAEMELALRDFEAAADHASQSRVLNDLGAIAEAVAADNFPGTMLFNLASVQMVRGRPDLAETRLREVVRARRAASSRRQLGEALGELGRALAQQGRNAESVATLDESFAILRDAAGSAQLKHLLHLRGQMAVERGEPAAIAPLAGRLRRAAEETGEAVALALALELEARAEGARGRLEPARGGFAQARRLLTEGGELDAAAECAAAEAVAEIRAGRFAEAEQAARAAAALLPPGAADSRMVVLAQAVRVRALAGAGRTREAEELFARLPDAARSPALDLRAAHLLARAVLARSAGRFDAARVDLEAVVAAARAAERKLDELDARLELAAVDLASAGRRRAAAPARAQAIAGEAARLGLGGLEARAGALAAPSRP